MSETRGAKSGVGARRPLVRWKLPWLCTKRLQQTEAATARAPHPSAGYWHVPDQAVAVAEQGDEGRLRGPPLPNHDFLDVGDHLIGKEVNGVHAHFVRSPTQWRSTGSLPCWPKSNYTLLPCGRPIAIHAMLQCCPRLPLFADCVTIYHYRFPGASSSGRTVDFGSASGGSNPPAPAFSAHD
jgi:hypothetical protein